MDTMAIARRRPALPAVGGDALHRLFLLVTTVALLAAAWSATALGQATVTRVEGTYAGELIVPVNKSQVLRVDVPFRRVAVGNAEIADVVPLSDRMVYVLGKQLGLTNLSIYGEDDRPLAILDVSVSHDIQGLKSRLNDLFPRETVEVRAASGAIVLSGTASSGQAASQMLAVAEQYAPEKVTNLMQVTGSQQVMLAVRFAEVSRTLSRELALNPLLSLSGDDAQFDLAPLTAAALGTTFGGIFSFATGDLTVDMLIDALESKGVVKTLAEPNLVAMSGDTASFLAGGEFPIPVAQEVADGGTTITVEFKQFGVSLSFTPTVVSGDLINLVVSPEVSQIDFTNAVLSTGFSIPGITTRRATTTVELRDGQSFAIAGLLQSEFTDNVDQLPWLGDVPVLGALFRSTNFQRDETELVIIVTPYLVQPGDGRALATPLDNFQAPSDLDLFFHGRVEAPPLGAGGVAPAPSGHLVGVAPAGGFAGDYGHIIQ